MPRELYHHRPKLDKIESYMFALTLVSPPAHCLLLPHVSQLAPLARTGPSRTTVAAQFSMESGTPSSRPESKKETALVKAAAVAVAGGAIRSSVRGMLPSAALTLAAVGIVRAMPTAALEALLIALLLSLSGLVRYFPFNFLVWAVGGGGFFATLHSCTVSVQRRQLRRRTKRRRLAQQREPGLNEAIALGREAEPEPPGLVLLVVASLVFSVFGSLP